LTDANNECGLYFRHTCHVSCPYRKHPNHHGGDIQLSDEFVAKFAARAASLPLGDPRIGPVVLGSVVGMSTVERCNALIDDALAKGAKLVCGGKAENTLMPATIIDFVTPDMRIYSEETFGPVKAIVRVDGEDAAVRVRTTIRSACLLLLIHVMLHVAGVLHSVLSRVYATSTALPFMTRPRCPLVA
jgi:Aldehyde dehydrogenase family